MKAFITYFLILVTAYCHSQPLSVGDNLYGEYHRLNPTKEINSPPMSPWLEENHLLLLTANEDVSSNKLFFLSTADKKLFGGFIKQSDSSYYLLDINNDSILDTKTEIFYMPYQFIKNKSKISPQDTSVLRMFNYFFTATMQADDNLDLDRETIDFLKSFYLDTSLANRHLVYLFLTYQTLITVATQQHKKVPTEICIPVIKSLADECRSIYKKVPPLVCIYKVEALLNDKSLTKQARQEVKLSLKLYPDCIPLQVYDHNLEQDSNLKEQKLYALKKNHPNHWMVKRL